MTCMAEETSEVGCYCGYTGPENTGRGVVTNERGDTFYDGCTCFISTALEEEPTNMKKIKIHPEDAETCDECGGQIMYGYGTNKPIYFTEEPENGLCSCFE